MSILQHVAYRRVGDGQYEIELNGDAIGTVRKSSAGGWWIGRVEETGETFPYFTRRRDAGDEVVLAVMKRRARESGSEAS